MFKTAIFIPEEVVKISKPFPGVPSIKFSGLKSLFSLVICSIISF
jgi:hypothetical protein